MWPGWMCRDVPEADPGRERIRAPARAPGRSSRDVRGHAPLAERVAEHAAAGFTVAVQVTAHNPSTREGPSGPTCAEYMPKQPVQAVTVQVSGWLQHPMVRRNLTLALAEAKRAVPLPIIRGSRDAS